MKRTAIGRKPFGEAKKLTRQTERQFQDQVIELATYLGWWVWHPYYAARSPEGYPDLTMFRERVVFAELKARNAKGRMGKLSPFQVEMAQRCFKANAEYYAWNPDDWDALVEVLTRGGSVKVVSS